MCYYFEPIKEAVATPFATGMPKEKVCQRLKKENPEICEVKYGKISIARGDFLRGTFIFSHLFVSLCFSALKVEKKEGEKVDYSRMKVKDLRTILDQRGVKCAGCSEKAEFVKKCEETEHLDL